MLARMADAIPPGMSYEPKWDGWRCMVWRDGDEVQLWSRRGTELTAQFPELVAGARTLLPPRCVLDGEVVITDGGRLQYTRLTERNVAGARAAAMARELPATFIGYDIVALGDDDLTGRKQWQRRELLEQLLGGVGWPFLLTPSTTDAGVARRWFDDFERAGLDGVVAKPPDGRYLPGERAIFKIKHVRTADVVIAGYRLDRTSRPGVVSLGSLQLGLFDDSAVLQYVGVCAGFPGARRRELAEMLATITVEQADAADHPWAPAQVAATGARIPEGIGRRESRHNDQVRLIDPLLVCEVDYDHLHDDVRFRSNTAFRRFRPDRDPESCTFDQLTPASGPDLGALLDTP